MNIEMLKRLREYVYKMKALTPEEVAEYKGKGHTEIMTNIAAYLILIEDK